MITDIVTGVFFGTTVTFIILITVGAWLRRQGILSVELAPKPYVGDEVLKDKIKILTSRVDMILEHLEVDEGFMKDNDARIKHIEDELAPYLGKKSE